MEKRRDPLRWLMCEHEWEEKIDSQYSNEKVTAVECVKCGCPGERNNTTGRVFWPTTEPKIKEK